MNENPWKEAMSGYEQEQQQQQIPGRSLCLQRLMGLLFSGAWKR